MAFSPPGRHAPSSPADDEGVRILRKPAASRFGTEARWAAGIAVAVGMTVAVSVWTSHRNAPHVLPVPAAVISASDAPPSPMAVHPIAADVPPAVAAAPDGRAMAMAVPQGDPDDLASYFRPGDPVPTTANLIKAMNEAGIRTGIAAFNPPGTSPPLEGLAVPADFELPPGYVRHHQATDEGETIEPILMFSPDLVLRDAQGRPIALPANRVVPPELAPPGLPLRWVRPGKS